MKVSSRQWLKDRPKLSYEFNLHNKDKFNKLAAENGYTCRNHRLIKTALVIPQLIEQQEVIDPFFPSAIAEESDEEDQSDCIN